jgi:uncharacterized protein (DUF4415 family)
VEFSWDEAKGEWVLAARGIDFLRVAVSLFDGRALVTVPTPRGEEERFLSVGAIDGKFYAVIWTWRGGAIRIVTAGERDMEKKSAIVRYTAEQIEAKIAGGEDRTDWRKANAITGKKLEASIKADVDDIREEPDWAQAVIGEMVPKDHINVGIDHDVLEWFKANSRGYQTLMNNVLRAFVKSRQVPGASVRRKQ